MIFAYSIIFVKCDVTVKDDWKNMWEEAEHSLKGKIEILCNNAGVPPKVNKMGRDACLKCALKTRTLLNCLKWQIDQLKGRRNKQQL